MKKPLIPVDAAYAPVPYDIAEVSACQAMARGEATSEQQRRVLDWLINKAAGTYDMSYRPSSERDTCFAEGRRFVGLQLVKMLNLDIPTLKKANNG